MAASTAKHEIRALLRAHLAAASGYRHLTRRCAVCHQLLRLALESPAEAFSDPSDAPEEDEDGDSPGREPEPPP